MSQRGGGWGLFLAAVLTSGLVAGIAGAQGLPPTPVPSAAPTTGLTPPPLTTPPPSPLDVAPPAYPPPLPSHDTLLDEPTGPCGWFLTLEAGIVSPHLRNGLTSTLNFQGLGTDIVQLPSARLDWVVAPRIEVGYQFADGIGEVALAYRGLSSEGRGDIPNFDALGDGLLHTRLDMDVLDLDYATPNITMVRGLDLKARLGARLADIFFDAQALGQFAEQRATNQFIGAGPHAGLDLNYHFSVPGLSLFARVDGALVLGHVHQGFDETLTYGDGTIIGSAATQGGSRAVPTFGAQLGIAWQPIGWRTRFVAGYEYEYWWNLGRVGQSCAELFDQGAFFRAEYNF